MHLPRIDNAMTDCGNHLATTNSFGTRIETFLTYSLLVIIYAEFEKSVRGIVQKKCMLIEDESLREIVMKCLGNVSRIQSGDLGSLLERFGAERKTAFRCKIHADATLQRAETFYNNLITHRHSTAHSDGSELTFDEVKTFYKEGNIVLDVLQETLLAADVA